MYSTISIDGDCSRLQLFSTTVHGNLRECLFWFPYKFQYLQALNGGDKQKRGQFADIVLHSQRVTENTYRGLFFLVNAFLHQHCRQLAKPKLWGVECPDKLNLLVICGPSVINHCLNSKERAISPFSETKIS